jgi:aerobic carbon-monoxide dehydrogenase small subunit
MTIEFILNGEDVTLKANPTDRLALILRDHFGLGSIVHDCGGGSCGKCMILLDGKTTLSCLLPVFRIRGSEVVTYEGFISTSEHELVRSAFNESGLTLCSYCTPARFMAAGSLLDRPSRPSETEVTETMSSVLCRCSPPSAVLRVVRGVIELNENRKYRRAR